MPSPRSGSLVGARQGEVRIAMDDGIELAATLYLPDPARGPQPCILEALPYRKDDLTSSYAEEYRQLRDEHGYAVCRLDLRGTGSSEGDATDEDPPREQQDLRLVIGWLAAQDWCDGSVGMYGTSYSGFNALQMACERPEQLKAIIAIYGSDDRYTDDVHYRGGILKVLDLVDYCHYMTPMNALPPVPAIWGDDWREEWVRRIETVEPWALTWLREQLDGLYWRHGSVRPGYERIDCPTMVIAGWADGYRNASFRLMERLRHQGVPHRLLAGPWAHAATESALPGPRIDSMPEMVAWWDRWLRGVDNGVDDGMSDDRPAITAFVRSSTRPSPVLDVHEGDWIREEWPSPRLRTETRAFAGRPPYLVRPDLGLDAWIDCAGHLPWGQSGDQRSDDAGSMTWEWDGESLTLLGHPRVRLQISADQPTAYVSVKLCDVFPDGTSALVSRGTLNLASRNGFDRMDPLQEGQVYDVEVELDACAYAFDPGQRMRLSIAGADWPNTAAPPRPVTLTVHSGQLELPVWGGSSPYSAPVLAPGGAASEDPSGVTWTVERDVLAATTACVVDHGSTYDIPHGETATEHYSGRVQVDRETFGQTTTATTTLTLRWPDCEISVAATMDVTISAETLDVTIELTAQESRSDKTVPRGSRSWYATFPRRG
jgi:putative CocE/NonD family hydrolase